MHRLEIRNQKLETRSLESNIFRLIPSSYFLVSNTCGEPEYNLRQTLGKVPAPIHMAVDEVVGSVQKQPQQAGFIPRSHQFLYTVYGQFYDIFQSVSETFVHIIHRAYIQSENSKKGII